MVNSSRACPFSPGSKTIIPFQERDLRIWRIQKEFTPHRRQKNYKDSVLKVKIKNEAVDFIELHFQLKFSFEINLFKKNEVSLNYNAFLTKVRMNEKSWYDIFCQLLSG